NVMAPVDEALAVASAELPEAPSAEPVPSHPPASASRATAVPRPGAPAKHSAWDDDAGPALSVSAIGAGAAPKERPKGARADALRPPARTSATATAATGRATTKPSASKSTGPVAMAMRAAMTPSAPPTPAGPRAPSRGFPGRPLRKTSPEDL